MHYKLNQKKNNAEMKQIVGIINSIRFIINFYLLFSLYEKGMLQDCPSKLNEKDSITTEDASKISEVHFLKKLYLKFSVKAEV